MRAKRLPVIINRSAPRNYLEFAFVLGAEVDDLRMCRGNGQSVPAGHDVNKATQLSRVGNIVGIFNCEPKPEFLVPRSASVRAKNDVNLLQLKIKTRKAPRCVSTDLPAPHTHTIRKPISNRSFFKTFPVG